MSGFYLMHRGWMDNPTFDTEPFTQREAFIWMIENAVWEHEGREQRLGYKLITIKRGQLSYSVRFLAKKWGWTASKVQRYTDKLKLDTLISTHIDTGQLVITICNYEKYQNPKRLSDTANETPFDTQTKHQPIQIYKEKELKERKEIKRNILVDFKKEFEEFWKSYPKKVAKQEALKIYSRIISSGKATPEDLLNGLKAYLQTEDVKRGYPCNPSTWLNQARWQDELEKSPELTPILPDSQKAKNLMYLRDTLQKPLDVQQSTWLKTYENQQGGLTNG